jgi:hypothetical protein
MIRSGAAAASIVALAIGLLACDRPSGPVTIEVDRPTALVDEPIHVRVTGLRAGTEAVVRIVRADGSLAKGARQRALLEAEGVPFRGERVDMRVARIPA